MYKDLVEKETKCVLNLYPVVCSEIAKESRK